MKYKSQKPSVLTSLGGLAKRWICWRLDVWQLQFYTKPT